jgi:hypothetical protein
MAEEINYPLGEFSSNLVTLAVVPTSDYNNSFGLRAKWVENII